MLNAEQLSKAPAIKIYNTKKNTMTQVLICWTARQLK